MEVEIRKNKVEIGKYKQERRNRKEEITKKTEERRNGSTIPVPYHEFTQYLDIMLLQY